jgi:hypothetical protein
MRAPLIALLLAVLAFAAAGCGGGQVSAAEVPGNPPTLAVPSDPTAGGAQASDGSAAGDQSDSSTSSSSSSTSSADSGSATAPAGATSAPEPAATATPQPQNDTSTAEQPAPGSDTQKFEDFCQQNAGAC